MAGTQSTPPQSTMQQAGMQQGETPSPLCNHFLEQVRLRLEGTLAGEELKKSTTEALKSLSEAREQTMSKLEADNVKDEVLDAFEHSFEVMQQTLEGVAGFAGEADQESYDKVREALFVAAAASTHAVVVLQQSQLSEGPTDMPLFNGLFKMKEGYLQGGVEGKQLKDALANIVSMTKNAISELLAGAGEQPPQRDGLVRAYEDQIESLERVGETIATGSKDKSRVDDAFDQLLKTSNGVREAMASLNEALMSQGPCRLTRTNVFLSASRSFQGGGIGADAFGQIVEEFETTLNAEQSSIDELVGMGNPHEGIVKEIKGVRKAYELQLEALAIFSAFIDGEGEPEDFVKAQKLLVEASEKLSDHKEELERLGESEGKISCIRCGALNEPSHRVCGKCGAQMPQQAGASGISSTLSIQEADGASAPLGAGELVVTANLERLFNAVNEIAEGRCSDADFEGVLDWMDGLLASAMKSVPEVPAMAYPEATEEQFDQIAELQQKLSEQRGFMLEGMAEVREALNNMAGYLEEQSKDILIQGVRAVRDGVVKMQGAEHALHAMTDALQKTAAEAQAKRDGVEGESSSPE